MNNKKDELEINKKNKDKLPFAVFIIPININENNGEDYKQVFTDIISDRINQKFK